MSRFRRIPSANEDESGQGLLFALMFLALFGLWITAVLGLATTDLTSASTVRNQRGTTYSADSAVWGAIELVRNETSDATFTTACPSALTTTSPTPIFQYKDPSINSSPTYYVNCLSTAIPNNPTDPFPGYPGYYVDFYASTSSSPSPSNSSVIAEATFTTSFPSPSTYSIGSWADETVQGG